METFGMRGRLCYRVFTSGVNDAAALQWVDVLSCCDEMFARTCSRLDAQIIRILLTTILYLSDSLDIVISRCFADMKRA